MSPNVQVGTREQCGPRIPKAVAHKTTTPSRRQPQPRHSPGPFQSRCWRSFRPKSSFPPPQIVIPAKAGIQQPPPPNILSILFIDVKNTPVTPAKAQPAPCQTRGHPVLDTGRESSNPPTSKHPVHPVHRCKKTPPSLPRKPSLPRARHGVTPYLIRGGNPEPPTSKHPVHPVHRCKKTPPSLPPFSSFPRKRESGRQRFHAPATAGCPAPS